MSSGSYDIFPYDFERLKKSIAEGASKNHSPTLMEKNHLRYLGEYLSKDDGIAARTVIVEKRYVDRDFLEDYAAYYARCFDDYERFCRRIHFFGIEISPKQLDDLLRKGGGRQSYAALADAYLGFIVVRPLPYRVIGRTCLKTYDNISGKTRHFPTVRDYPVNLFGMELSVSSVAFQEQDREVSACATSALWSAFQVTSARYNHPAPSPFEITRIATKATPSASRTFPNGGLTEQQVADAIRHVGLEPVTISVRREEPGATSTDSRGVFDADKFKALFYAYNRCGIPVIVTVDIYETDGTKRLYKGFHGVTGLGYRFPTFDEIPPKFPSPEPRGLCIKFPEDDAPIIGPNIKATTISPIFVHDDQAGPFACLRFINEEVRISWYSDKNAGTGNDNDWYFVAEPKNIVIPLYHKVRVSFFDAHRVIQEFDAILRRYLNGHGDEQVATEQGLIWDLYLCQAQDLRKSLFESKSVDEDLRARMLTTNLPRYIWRATGYLSGKAAVDVFLDATGLSNGTNVFCALAYHEWIDMIARHFVKRLETLGGKVRENRQVLFDRAEAVIRSLLDHRTHSS